MSALVSLQTQLLLAAFASPQQAVPAWARWQSESDWERHLDFESYLLLPRVYHNLDGRGVDDALFKRLKGVVKRNWAANAATLVAIRRIADILQQSGIASVLMPPCSLLLRDRSAALAPGTPIAYQIARRDAQCVTRLLSDAGWRCVANGVPRWSLPGYIAAVSHISMRDGDGTTLDLHWVDALESVAGGSASHDLHGQTIRSPGTRASMRLLFDSPGMGSELCRLSRVLLLLEKAPDEDGWLCLLQQLQQRYSPFLDLVAELSPVVTVSGISAGDWNADPSERPVTTASGTQIMTFRQRLAKPWQYYRRVLGDETSTVQALRYLPGYLMGKWVLQHFSEILPSAYRALRYHWRQRNVDQRGQF